MQCQYILWIPGCSPQRNVSFFTMAQSKESTPRGRGFDLPPEGALYNLKLIQTITGVVECWSNGKTDLQSLYTKTRRSNCCLYQGVFEAIEPYWTPILHYSNTLLNAMSRQSQLTLTTPRRRGFLNPIKSQFARSLKQIIIF